jgi:hypothetical protein
MNSDHKRIARLETALREISEGRGTFSRDPLEHASNCIEEMKAIAIKALEQPDNE